MRQYGLSGAISGSACADLAGVGQPTAGAEAALGDQAATQARVDVTSTPCQFSICVP